MSESPEEGTLPKWFVRLVVGFCFGAMGGVGGAIWWASSLSTSMQFIQESLNTTLARQAEDLKELDERLGDLELRHQYLDKRVEVILDRTQTRSTP